MKTSVDPQFYFGKQSQLVLVYSKLLRQEFLVQIYTVLYFFIFHNIEKLLLHILLLIIFEIVTVRAMIKVITVRDFSDSQIDISIKRVIIRLVLATISRLLLLDLHLSYFIINIIQLR